MSSIHFESTYDDSKLLAGIRRSNMTVDQWAKNTMRRTAGVGTAFGNMSTGILGSAAKMGVAGGVMVAAFKFKQIAQEAYDFETAFGMAMREVQTISVAVQDDIEGISKKIVDLAANGPDDAIKLAKAYYQIVSAGYDGEQGLKLLDIATKAATAGLTDTTTAADGLTSIINAWKLEATEATKVADVMFKTVERGKTTFGELASNIAQVAPLAAANDISYNEIFAAIQTLTKQGTSTSEAITQIRSSIIGMNEALGDGWQKTMTYQEGLQSVVDMAGGSQNKLKELLGRVEGVNAALAITGKNAKGAAEDMEANATALGAMETAYGRMMEEADNKWAVVHNKWNRQLREFGVYLKEASTEVANLLDILLTDKQADIIDPGAQKIVDGVVNSISSLTDKDAKLSAIIGKINELRSKRIDELNPTITGLEDQQPGWFRRNVESLNAGLGLGSAFTPGRTKQAELGLYNNQLQITKQAEEELLKLYGEVFKEADKANDKKRETAEEKVRTLKDMIKEYENLQSELGAGTVVDDVNILSEMEVIRNEIRDYYEKIREIKKVDAPEELTAINPQLESNEIEDVRIESDKILKIDKQRRQVAQEQADAIKEQNDRLTMQEVLSEAAHDIFSDTSEILGALSYAISEIDSDLGESVGKMADLAYNAANLAANLSSGNLVGAIASGIGILGSLFSGMSESTESLAEAQQRVNEKALELNDILREQIKLLVDAGLISMSEGRQRDLTTLKEELELNKNEFEKYIHFILVEGERTGVSFKKIMDTVYGNAWGAQELNEALKNLDLLGDKFLELTGYIGYSNYPLSNAFAFPSFDENEFNESVNKLIQTAADLSELHGADLGFDSNDIANTIVDGIEEGLKLSESGLGQWTDKFKLFLSSAGYEALKVILQDQFLSGFTENFKKAMSDGSLEGDLYGSGGLIDQFKQGITIANDYWAKFNDGLGEFSLDQSSQLSQSGLVGSIRRDLTEETGGELAGILRKSSDDTRQIRDYTADAVAHMAAIEANTHRTAEGVESSVVELQNAVTELKSINSNTSPSQTGRDMGL
ncbi:phage tail tape measure protein [Sunxiuqinia sp. A32]|uniref:phage tail tape measure protein n=1 Tax=Sunxiuqinia sp. A32 TaxID=3461496 RepID=UPI0040462979